MSGPDVSAAHTVDPTARLEQLKAQATQQYSLKNYAAAADFYSEAAEVQDSINGEMSVENAELLYYYGRCLYHVAVQNSDVLGGKVASAEEPKRKKRKVASAQDNGEDSSAAAGSAGSSLIGDAIKGSEQAGSSNAGEGSSTSAVGQKKATETSSKPFFQITGDENWTDSEDEGEEAEGEGQDGEEEEDDFATAYEILDMARVLLARKIESLRGDDSKAVEIRQLEERLADTHDLQAEISLENERFADAINDTRDALTLKLHLYPTESSLVAEAHFKLSLALEFASVTSTEEDASGNKVAAAVDESMREEAATEMEKAIASCKLRMEKESAALPGLSGDKAADLQRQLADIKEMISDMKQRLVDLRNPAASLSGLQGGASADALGSDEAIRGVLGAMLGESKAGQQKLLAEATQNATDLSGLVKKRKKRQTQDNAPSPVEGSSSNGKRKAEGEGGHKEASEAAPVGNGNVKRVKFEEPLASADGE